MNRAGDVWCVAHGNYIFGPTDREAAMEFQARFGGLAQPLWGLDERDLGDPGKRLARDIAMVEGRKAA